MKRPAALMNWVWRSYVRAALVPLLVVEVALVGAYLVTNGVTRETNIDAIRSLAEDELVRIAERNAEIISSDLTGIAAAAELFRRQTVHALITQHEPPPEEASRYAMSSEGVFYTTFDNGGAAAFYSGFVPVGPEERRKALQLAQLDPLMRDMVAASPMISQIYLNTFDSYNRIYPYFDVLSQFPAKLDIPTFNFYYEADEIHNPRRSVVWTDVYVDPAGQGWMASAIAPAYVGRKLEAVIGLDVTVGNFVDRILTLSIPWEGYGILIGKQGTIMALPPQGEADLGLSELTAFSYDGAVTADTFKPEEFNLLEHPALAALGQRIANSPEGLGEVEMNGRKLAAWATIPETGWRLLVLAPEDRLYAEANALSQRFTRVAVVMIAGLIVFYALFFLFLYARARKQSATIAKPLMEINQMVDAIGRGDYSHDAPQFFVRELSETASGVAEMGRSLQRSQHALNEAARRMEEQAEFRRLLIDSLPAPLYFQDQSGRFIGCNAAFEEFFGCRRDDLRDRPVAEFLPDLMERGARELRLPDQRDRIHVFSHLMVPIGGAVEQRPGWMGVLFDISERKRGEQAMEEARDKALEASRLKSEFLASISHELRTPLNGIVGMTELLQTTELDQDQHHYASVVGQSARSLTRIIDDVLDFAELDRGTARPNLVDFQPASLLREVVERYKPAANARSLALNLDVLAGLSGQLRGDARRIGQILDSLIGNALKFTERGGVGVSATLADGPGGGTMLRLRVTDTGIGISESDIKQIFQPFTQGDGSNSRRFGGAGMGLGLSRALVDLLGGRIGVESETQVGSTFWFEVPVRIAEAAPARSTTQPDLSGSRVLVVEDNPVNMQIIRRSIAPLNCRADFAVSGPEAVGFALGQSYDLILMDVHLPGFDGLSAARQIRSHYAASGHKTIIVAVTANASAEDRDKLLAAGMDDYIAKPFTPAQMRAFINWRLSGEDTQSQDQGTTK